MDGLECDCPNCEGRGCSECDDRGKFAIRVCPYEEYVDEDIRDLVRFAALARDGVLPAAGGSLDQEHWFMEAAARLWYEQDILARPEK